MIFYLILGLNLLNRQSPASSHKLDRLFDLCYIMPMRYFIDVTVEIEAETYPKAVDTVSEILYNKAGVQMTAGVLQDWTFAIEEMP